MPVRKWGWKPREVERAIEVVRKTGLTVTGVTIKRQGRHHGRNRHAVGRRQKRISKPLG